MLTEIQLINLTPFFAVPVLAGIFSYIGAFAAARPDIAWIKDTLKRHERQLTVLHGRIGKG